jgi:hypothetical protein
MGDDDENLSGYGARTRDAIDVGDDCSVYRAVKSDTLEPIIVLWMPVGPDREPVPFGLTLSQADALGRTLISNAAEARAAHYDPDDPTL